MSEMQTYLQTNPSLTRAVVAYFCRDDQLLLGVRKRVSDGLGHELLAGIGGKVEPGETDEQALVRECLEEIKVRPTSWEKVGLETYLFPHKPKWNQLVVAYLVMAWDGTPQETDDIRPVWLPKTELPTVRTWADNLITIPLVLAGKHHAGVFLYTPDETIAEHTVKYL